MKKFSLKPIIGIVIVTVFGFVIFQKTVENIEIAWDIITPEELERRLPPRDFVLIDVRQPDEYKNGHIPGAILIPLNTLKQELDTLDPEKEIVVYCASGKRSARAAGTLSSYGFAHIKTLAVGMKGWKGKIEKQT